jgi:hypothetical protein
VLPFLTFPYLASPYSIPLVLPPVPSHIEADAEGNEDLIEDDAVMGKCRDCQQVLTMKESLTHMNEKHAQDIEKVNPRARWMSGLGVNVGERIGG